MGVTAETARLYGTFVSNSVHGEDAGKATYYGWCGANVWSTASFRPIELVSKSGPEPSEEQASGGSTHRTAGWIQLQDGNWKYRGENGRFVTGWQKVKNIWYYMDDHGIMLTGWQKINGVWYYLKDWGGMATGWQKINGTWYYLKNWGGMAAGTTTPDGYQVDWNGAWIRT